MKKDTFCIMAWTHFHTHVDGTVRLCCLSQTPLFKLDGSSANIRRDSPIEIWNGHDYKTIRRSMLNGEVIPHCRLCYECENNGFTSRRIYMNQFLLENMLQNKWSTDDDKLFDRLVDGCDPTIAKLPIYFDIRLGNICNLRCRMCGPQSSSQLERDEVSRKWHGDPAAPIVGADVSDWPEAVGLLDRLKTLCIDAVRIDLIGGEPTMNESQLKLLEHLIEQKVANNIDLSIISNLTNTRDRAFKIFSHFKSTEVRVSIDGVGAVYNYIRFPGNWDAVSCNVRTVRKQYPKFNLRVFPTVQVYNVLYLVELFDWCLESGLQCELGNILFVPPYLRMSVMPMEARKFAAEKLERWVQAHNITGYFNPEEVQRIIDYLRDECKQSPTNDVHNFIRYTNDLDRSRGQDIRICLPEVYSSLSNIEGW